MSFPKGNFMGKKFLHRVLLVLMTLFLLGYVFSFIPFTIKSNGFFWQNISVFFVVKEVFSGSWEIFVWIIFGLLLLLLWVYFYFACSNRGFKNIGKFSFVLVLFMLIFALLGLRSFFREQAGGAMQYLLKGNVLYVRVDSWPCEKGVWTYPLRVVELTDSSKVYPFIHFVFRLKGHHNIYIFQRYWSVMEEDTLYIKPHPFVKSGKILSTQVHLYLKKGTKVLVDKHNMGWLLGDSTAKGGTLRNDKRGFKVLCIKISLFF
jgi:hypothetical protein